MKRILLVLVALSATVPASALFGPRYEYDEYGNAYRRRGLVGSVASGIVHAGEDVVDVATSPVRGGYTEVRLDRVQDRITDIRRELKNRDLTRNEKDNLKRELRDLEQEKGNLERNRRNSDKEQDRRSSERKENREDLERDRRNMRNNY